MYNVKSIIVGRTEMNKSISKKLFLLLSAAVVAGSLMSGCASSVTPSSAAPASVSAAATTEAPAATKAAATTEAPAATKAPAETKKPAKKYPGSIGTVTVTAKKGVDIYPEAGSDVEPCGHAKCGSTFPVFKKFTADGDWNYYEITNGRYLSARAGKEIKFAKN